MRKILLAVVYGGAVFIVGVAATHIVLGQSWIPGTGPVTPSLDSEHRFYTSLFLMYGFALAWCARDLERRQTVFHYLLLTLFVGGLSRIVSLAVVGLPHPMFWGLGAIEVLVPPVLWRMSLTVVDTAGISPEHAHE